MFSKQQTPTQPMDIAAPSFSAIRLSLAALNPVAPLCSLIMSFSFRLCPVKGCLMSFLIILSTHSWVTWKYPIIHRRKEPCFDQIMHISSISHLSPHPRLVSKRRQLLCCRACLRWPRTEIVLLSIWDCSSHQGLSPESTSHQSGPWRAMAAWKNIWDWALMPVKKYLDIGQ